MKRLIKISLIASLFFYSACSDENNTKTQNAMPPSLVDVKGVKPVEAKIYYEYASKLEADKNVYIMPKISGEIKEQLFNDGDFVKKGNVLYKIDKDQYKANLDVALADIQVAKANYENAQTDYQRTKDLYAKKAVSKKEYDAKSALFKSAQASLSKANASYKIAKLNYEYTDVKAPFDGYVQSSLVDIGSYAVANNTKLVQIVDQNKLKAVFYISDKNMSQIKDNNNELDGAKAEFEYNGKKYEGIVKFISNYTDLASTKAYAEFDNFDQELSAGLFVNLKLVDIKQSNAYIISKENLLQDIDGYYVYIKSKGKAEQVHVKPIFDDEKIAVVKASDSKLKENDELILNNYKKIYPGANVATDAEFGAMMKQSQQAKAVKEPSKEK